MYTGFGWVLPEAPSHLNLAGGRFLGIYDFFYSVYSLLPEKTETCGRLLIFGRKNLGSERQWPAVRKVEHGPGWEASDFLPVTNGGDCTLGPAWFVPAK